MASTGNWNRAQAGAPGLQPEYVQLHASSAPLNAQVRAQEHRRGRRGCLCIRVAAPAPMPLAGLPPASNSPSHTVYAGAAGESCRGRVRSGVS